MKNTFGILFEIFGISKLEYRLSYGIVYVVLGLAVLVEFRIMTDRQTDRHTMTAYNALA